MFGDKAFSENLHESGVLCALRQKAWALRQLSFTGIGVAFVIKCQPPKGERTERKEDVMEAVTNLLIIGLIVLALIMG
jgi:hypothetical protein